MMGAGLRTWLNAAVLSLVFVFIIAAQALLKGMNEQTAQAVIASEYGAGQIWHAEYDPQVNPVNRLLFQAFGAALTARQRHD